MKLLIYTQVWKRPEITEICFIGINRLRKLCPQYQIEAFAVISEEEFIPLCNLHKIHWVMAENLPLGRKHNTGIREALKLDWDYVMNIGSDDIVSHEIFTQYQKYFDRKCDFFGINSIGFFDAKTQGFIFNQTDSTFPYGAARVMSRRLIEQVDPFWPDELNKGLDRASQANARERGFDISIVKINEPLVIDIKSNVNIWGFKKYSGIQWDIHYISTKFSQREYKLLQELKDKVKMAAKIYEYRGMTKASIKVFLSEQRYDNEGKPIPREATVIDFTDGGNIGGQEGSPRLIPACATVHDEKIQNKIEEHPLFKNGTIVLKVNLNLNPKEEIKFEDEPIKGSVLKENEVEDVEEVTNRNEAAFYLRNRYPDLKTTDVNSKAKIKEVAEVKKLRFPNFNVD